MSGSHGAGRICRSQCASALNVPRVGRSPATVAPTVANWRHEKHEYKYHPEEPQRVGHRYLAFAPCFKQRRCQLSARLMQGSPMRSFRLGGRVFRKQMDALNQDEGAPRSIRWKCASVATSPFNANGPSLPTSAHPRVVRGGALSPSAVDEFQPCCAPGSEPPAYPAVC